MGEIAYLQPQAWAVVDAGGQPVVDFFATRVEAEQYLARVIDGLTRQMVRHPPKEACPAMRMVTSGDEAMVSEKTRAWVEDAMSAFRVVRVYL